ncbi:flagellin N-terminal helical domain-containing protein [Rhizobium sp. C4]|uniref:flagellin N-terminal helical domain-containing protein n=1 Tax=Rhizobium sp. C4 TaxID=1349800 RepID=UPI001E2BDD2F|nr:flagellin [Rhizobium sp. C4]MCD2175361.1 hypothetical protein [Rhizobium sp. C4]
MNDIQSDRRPWGTAFSRNQAQTFQGGMTSIRTNVSAIAALQTLRSVDASLDGAQRTISSGLRVQSASDNAAYWSIATSMRSDKSVLSTVSDSIGIAKGILDVTYNGMDKVRSELTTIKTLVVGARDLPTPTTTQSIGTQPYWPSSDPAFDQSEMAKVDREIVQHFDQISTIIRSSSFSGVNLLVHQADGRSASSSTIEFVTGYTAGGGIQKTSLSLADTTMVDYNYNGPIISPQFGQSEGGFLGGPYFVGHTFISPSGVPNVGRAFPLTYDFGTSVFDSQLKDLLRPLEWWAQTGGTDPKVGFDVLISELDKRIENIVAGMSKVGAVQTRLDHQDDFIGKLTDTLAKGVGRLVDADMNQASTRIKALQTQQQLAIQSLSIANGKSESIMQLIK